MGKTIVNNISNIPKINISTPNGMVICYTSIELDFKAKVIEELNLKKLEYLSFQEVKKESNILKEIEQGQHSVVSDTDSVDDSVDKGIEAREHKNASEQEKRKIRNNDNVKSKNTNRKSAISVLKGMTKEQLNDFAAINDIVGVSMYMKKVDIIEVISRAIKSKSGG